jgi:hypothetical protein
MGNEHQAVGLYAVLARDATDFIDMLDAAPDDALELLYLMLTVPNDEHDDATVKLNKLGSGFVERALKGRGLALPEPSHPTRWDRLVP